MSEAQTALDNLKAMCRDGESQEEHDTHAAELAALYATFQGDGSPSNPATGDTPLTAAVVVVSDLTPA
jgi:hypothetical protein